jgi:arylsulfatase A-like enzyme
MQNHTLRRFSLLSGVILICSAITHAAESPNVILIMTDDQGYGDIGSHGNPWLKTPNLDELASQSVRLDDYRVSPYCVPSRAALLTGRYADRTGIHNVLAPDWIARGDEFMMSVSFKDAGYATGMFGKWHLGARDSQAWKVTSWSPTLRDASRRPVHGS